eukprot:464295_1
MMQPSWLYLAIVLLLQVLISDAQSTETSDEKQEIQTLDTENNDSKVNPAILAALLSAGICIILCFCIYIIRHRWNSTDQKEALPNNPRSDDTFIDIISENEKEDEKNVESSPLVQKTKTQMIVDAGDEDLHKFKSIVRFALNVDSSDMHKMNSADHDNEQLELILNDMTSPSNAKVNDMKLNNCQNMDNDQTEDKISNRYRNDSMLSDEAHSMI